jgi:hypothetical protein
MIVAARIVCKLKRPRVWLKILRQVDMDRNQNGSKEVFENSTCERSVFTDVAIAVFAIRRFPGAIERRSKRSVKKCLHG